MHTGLEQLKDSAGQFDKKFIALFFFSKLSRFSGLWPFFSSRIIRCSKHFLLVERGITAIKLLRMIYFTVISEYCRIVYPKIVIS